MKSLENLTKFIEKLDEGIHRGYSRITKKWEDKGRSKYFLSGLCDTVGTLSGFYYSGFDRIKGPLLSSINGISIAKSGMGIIIGEHPIGVKEESGKFVVNDKFNYFLENLGKTIRMPELIAGIGFTGKGVINLYNYFSNNDSSSLNEGLESLSLGISLVSNSSAWYIRDSDPKLLDKKPLLKQAFKDLSNNIKSSLPQPQPELKPIPIKVNFQKHL